MIGGLLQRYIPQRREHTKEGKLLKRNMVIPIVSANARAGTKSTSLHNGVRMLIDLLILAGSIVGAWLLAFSIYSIYGYVERIYTILLKR